MVRPKVLKWLFSTILVCSIVLACVNVLIMFSSTKPLPTHLNSESSRESPKSLTKTTNPHHETVQKTEPIYSQRLNKDILEEMRRQRALNRAIEMGISGIKISRNESFAKVKSHAVAYLTYEDIRHVVRNSRFQPGQVVESDQSENILLVSTWRSGSTFLGELLNQMPGTFYNFEPLIFFDREGLKPNPEMANDLIYDMTQCRTSQEFLDSSSDVFNEFILSRNVRPWDACQFVRARGTDENFCFNATMYNELCRLYPKRLVKVVRGKLADLKSLVIDKIKFRDLSSNLKVVVLLRDPRGIMNSRYHVDWCQDDCLDEAELCKGNDGTKTICVMFEVMTTLGKICLGQNLESNLNEARLLAQTHPGQVYLLRYEDLCIMPEKHVLSLFQFLGQPVSQVIKKYTVLHMSTQDSDVHGTRRKAKHQAFLWTTEMPISDIRRVEGQCRNFMTQAGYVDFPYDSQWTEEFQFLTSDTLLWNYTESNEHWFL